MRILSRLAILLAACAAGLTAQSTSKQLPPPFQTPSADNRSRIVPRPAGARIRVPSGFTVDVAADGFDTPRFMLLGPGNEILMSDSVSSRDNAGSVYVLLDRNRAGKIDAKTKILQGLDRPYGLAFWKDYLYVAETTSLKRYKYDAKTMTVGSAEEIVPMKDFGQGHITRTVLFNQKGDKMYLAVGSSANVVTGDPPMRAAINRFNPDGTGHEIVATGLRNPIGLRAYPGTDNLWATVQERDGLGDDLV